MKPFQVTVIIPTYNRADYLKRSVPSVLNQADVQFELLIIDDGSSDDTQEVIDDITKNDPRVRYWYQGNQGPSAARNFGIKESLGEFIAFLDSDDEWLPGKLKKQLQFFERNQGFIICQTEEIWIRNGVRVNPMDKHKKRGGNIFEYCLPLSIISPSCVMMKRHFFDQVGLFDESFPACEDYDLWLRASARFPIGLIPDQLVIKTGGHPDQRSQAFAVMDRFRIQSIVKLIESGILSKEQLKLSVTELVKKCRIVQSGAVKRNKTEEADHMEAIITKYSSLITP